MSCLGTHVFDLPDEIFFEVLKRLDTKSIEKVGSTCKYFREKVKEFGHLYKDLLEQKKRCENVYPAGYLDSDEEDFESWDGNPDLDDDDFLIRDLDDYDNYSMGSNMDEELEAHLRG